MTEILLRIFFRHKQHIAVVSFFLLLAFVCFNIFRIGQYRRLLRAEGNHLQVFNPLHEFDPISGFRYARRRRLTAHWMGPNGETLRTNRIRTNFWGQISDVDSNTSPELKKSPGVTRIAVLGDSLTACIHNNHPWPGILERLLNTDPGKRFEVLNFARDGIGIEQFPAILESEVLRFNPDLVLVNFIASDIHRGFVWRRTVEFPGNTHRAVLNCTSLPAEFSNRNCHFAGIIVGKGDTQAFKSKLANLFADRFSWFLPRLVPLPDSEIDDRTEAISRSARALTRLSSQNIPMLYLHLPTYPEIVEKGIPKLIQDLKTAVPNLTITPMLSFLPQAETEEEIQQWINFPTDMHWSDKGAEVYAKAVLERLKIHFLSTEATVTASR